ncbi:Uncharacterised protein [Providencia rettgeri]|uniref:Uncharacterized protein n=1 Tax=Providencia rettgeri TaxID=587 RepID=A0A379FU75_PRORE|nr:Uncharacterised protein [Providencia rettgeri]
MASLILLQLMTMANLPNYLINMQFCTFNKEENSPMDTLMDTIVFDVIRGKFDAGSRGLGYGTKP